MTPETIVRNYLEAIATKQLDRLAELVAPDVRFTGPVSTFTSRAEVCTALRRIGAVHVRSDIKRIFTDGNEVCAIYDFVTDTVGAVPTIEWIRVEGGQIRSVNLYYDQLPWIRVREELAKRAAS
jgi:hypothetical protein